MAFALGDVPHPQEKGYMIPTRIESSNRMDDRRVLEFRILINALLNSSKGEEAKILPATFLVTVNLI
jgi:hypothetical protein